MDELEPEKAYALDLNACGFVFRPSQLAQSAWYWLAAHVPSQEDI